MRTPATDGHLKIKYECSNLVCFTCVGYREKTPGTR